MNIVVVKYPTGIILHTHIMGDFCKKKFKWRQQQSRYTRRECTYMVEKYQDGNPY